MRELSVLEAIEKRRSTRHFKADAIPETVLNALIDAAADAPSSWNFQPWRVVLVESLEGRSRLAEACWNQAQVAEAPAVFVFGAALHDWPATIEQTLATAKAVGAWDDEFAKFVRERAPAFQQLLGDRIREFAVKDTMIAATHLALAAESVGLASSFMNGWDEFSVKAAVGAGDDIAIAVVMAVGYARETPRHPGRLPRRRLFFRETFGEPYRFRPTQLRSPRETLLGLIHLPRLIDKVRLGLRGHLPGYNFINAGFDKFLLDLLGVSPDAFVEAVRSSPDDTGVVAWLDANAKPLTEAERNGFNERLHTFGATDPSRTARLRNLLDSVDPSRREITTFIDLIDLAEGRL